jgi:tRNA (guanine37-N1)-methyltransferase
LKGNLRIFLKGRLTPEELGLVYKSYDVIGDVAVIRIPKQLLAHAEAIGQALMTQHKNVKAVWQQSGPVTGDFRLRKLKLIAGERKTETVYKEHGCVFKVDIEKCYFSPRLGFERIRIARLVENDEVIVNMFAGVGCYSIVISKHSNPAKIYSIDINPVAVRYMRENILLNKMADKVLPLKGDAREIVVKKLRNQADRVFMPLPEKAYNYLDAALSAVKPQGGWIHYYAFEHARKEESPIKKAKAKIVEVLKPQNVTFELPLGRVVRQTGPNWYQIAIDIQIESRATA